MAKPVKRQWVGCLPLTTNFISQSYIHPKRLHWKELASGSHGLDVFSLLLLIIPGIAGDKKWTVFIRKTFLCRLLPLQIFTQLKGEVISFLSSLFTSILLEREVAQPNFFSGQMRETQKSPSDFTLTCFRCLV